jgi:glutathione S-transferase
VTRLAAFASGAYDFRMILYLLHKCPFGHRAAMVVREKKLDAELRFFESGKRPAELEAVGPRAKSPTIFDGDTRVYDSAVVLEYLEDRYPQPALMPKDPAQRAAVRMLIARYNDEIGSKNTALITEILFKKERDEAKIAAAKRAFLDALVPWNAYFDGRTFAVGDALTLADITLYTFFPSVKSHANLEIPAELTHLRAWHDRMKALPSAPVPAPPA